MCVKIIGDREISYDSSKPLEDQIVGSKQIVINYEPSDSSIDKFLEEVKRLSKNGKSVALNVEVIHNNHLNGMGIKNQVKKLSRDMDINEFIKMMTLMQSETDKKLEELTKHCRSCLVE